MHGKNFVIIMGAVGAIELSQELAQGFHGS
jgi:hypothetical protein